MARRLTASVGLLCAALLPGVVQGKSRPCPPVPGAALGVVRCGGRAVTRADCYSGACWRGWLGHHQVCGSVVVPPSPGSGVAGGGSTPVRLQAACLWLVSCHRPRGQGRGMVGWRLLLRHGAAVGAASRAVPQPCQASDVGHRAAGRLDKARWYQAPSTPVPGAASADMVQGPLGVATSCGEGGTRVGGGGRSPRGQGTRVRSQHPNKGVQATPSSLRSSLAAASRRA